LNPVAPRPPVSAALITLDAIRTIGPSLASLGFCDEVIVLDSGSTDGTIEAARDAGARVEHLDWSGFRDQKNAVARLCRNDWILSIDADEAVTPRLAREITTLFAEGRTQSAGYTVPRLTRYLGREIRHAGWYPDRAIRLYDRRQGRWIGGQVHERVEVDGTVGRLHGDLLHEPYAGLSHHLEKMNRYSTLAAETLHARGRRAAWIDLALRPPLAFAKKYLAQRGFLDGLPGFIVAASTSMGVFLRYAKLWDLARRDAPRDAAAAADRSRPPEGELPPGSKEGA
jgi:glycosyltransferase involved in cell wall biosynthesis